MRISDFKAQIKAVGKADGLGEGEFKAYVSTFGVKDSVGDVVMPGAFADSLAEDWKDDPLPVIWSHNWMDAYAHIGYTIKATEDDRGLLIHGKNDIEDNPLAAQVQRLLKGRRVKQFSFAYDIIEGGPAVRENGDQEGEEVFELHKLKLHETGPTLLGVNRDTELLAAKALSVAEAVNGERPLTGTELDQVIKAANVLREVIKLSVPKGDTPAGTGYDEPEPDDTSQTDPAPAADDPPQGDKTNEGDEVPRRIVMVESLFM